MAEETSGQPLTSMVLGEFGFVSLASISVGDKIIGSSGQTQKVESVEDHEVQPIFRVGINDGATAECAAGQIWTIRDEDKEIWDMSARDLQDSAPISFDLPAMAEAPVLDPDDEVYLDLPEPNIMFHMLSEEAPEKGTLIFAYPDTEDLNRTLTVLPDYALATAKTQHAPRFFYSDKTLAHEDVLPLLKRSGLLSGDASRFRIPGEYQYTSVSVRRAMLKAFSGYYYKSLVSLHDLRMILEGLPLDDERFSASLKQLVWSMGWSLDGEPRKLVASFDTGYAEEVRSLRVSSRDGMYVTDNYILTSTGRRD